MPDTGPVYLPPTKARIFRAIKRSGSNGMTVAQVLEYTGLEIRPSTVKVHVNQINDLLAGTGHRIADARGRRGYRLLIEKAAQAANGESHGMADMAADGF